MTPLDAICDQHLSPQKWSDTSQPTRPAGYVIRKDQRRRARRGYAAYVAKRRTRELVWSLAGELAGHTTKAFVERRFQKLAAQWEAETGHISSITDLTSH